MLVPAFDLICRYCEYHLFGLRRTRCPECGKRFTWAEVLTDYHGRRHGLFEYQWRRSPLRSLGATWLKALDPRSLWRLIDIHSPPNVKPLTVMALAAIVVFAVLAPACVGATNWLSAWICNGRETAWGTFYYLRRPLYQEIVAAGSSAAVSAIVLFSIAWCATSLASLLLFVQSMRRYKVRPGHVLRVWAYCVPLKTVLLPAVFAPACAIDSYFSYPLNYVEVFAATALPGMLHVVWSLREGYKTYLHMDHSWAVAVASQMVALLAALAICGLFVPDFSESMMYALMDLQRPR